jgi:hypothetical protein
MEESGMKEILLKKGVAAWVDDEDFEQFGGAKWRLHPSGTACRDGKPFTGRNGVVLLPRLIVGAHSGQIIRWKNNIKLDCRRANLQTDDRVLPKRRSREEDLNAIVLRFAHAFPDQRRFGLPRLRLQLQEAWGHSGIPIDAFLRRIEGWAEARANIGPRDLENPAPVLQARPAETPPAAIVLPPASAKQAAFVRSLTTEWVGDGTE